MIRVIFGAGVIARLGAEIDALGFRRVLLVTTPGRRSALVVVLNHLGARVVDICDRAAMHVPVERVERALEDVNRAQPDALVAVGGGSAIGLAKALARERPLPIVAVPTTYSGSEMTSIWGMTDGDRKTTGRDPVVTATLVVYDPELTLSLPPHASAASGMNAMAHAVEAMYAPVAGADVIETASRAIASLAHALPEVVSSPHDLPARTEAFRGAHDAGVVLERVPMGLHHKLCHVLGGLGLPHAETHAALLPHVVEFNAGAAPEAMARIAAALGVADAAAGLDSLNRTLGLTRSLAALGLTQAQVSYTAESVASGTFPNPRAVRAEDVRRLLDRALP